MSVLDSLKKMSGSFVAGTGLVKSAGELFDAINPSNEEVIGQYADCTEQEVLDVIATANTVQKEWKKTDHLHRAELLHASGRRPEAMSPRWDQRNSCHCLTLNFTACTAHLSVLTVSRASLRSVY